MTIYQPDIDFDFSKIHLAQPIVTANGSFFSKINVTSNDESLFIYTPKSVTKQGVVVTKDKMYTDLSFTMANTNIIQWITTLEERLQQLIYEKKDSWFATENIELDDIQNAFVPIIKIYKNSNYVLRAYIQQSKHQLKGEPLLIYNENEQPCTVKDISETTPIITILEIQGIKFSQKSFHIPIVIKQIMLFQKTSFTQCLIKSSEPIVEPIVEHVVEAGVEPVIESVVEPVIESVVEPIVEPVVEPAVEPVVEPDIKVIDVDTNSLDDAITIKNPREQYNAIVEKIKQSSLEVREAYLIAKELKQQFNIEEELPIL
jgi:hypothetical protein